MTPTRRRFLAHAAAAGALASLWPGPLLAGGVRAIGGSAFGSYWRGVFPAQADADHARHLVDEVVALVDRQMSPYRPGSDLSLFNRPGAGAVRLPPETARTAAAALALARDTGGAFDPTVGPLVSRYGFGPIEGGRAGDWRALVLNGDLLQKTVPDLTLDLCGIAKGFALDRIRDRLIGAGFDSFILDLGGEVAAHGRHPEGRAWQVAVEDGLGGMAGLMPLAGLAVATSGLSAQSYAIGGSRYGHIIDPRAARPAGADLASVSVVHPSAMQADGLATALFAMGNDAAESFARGAGIDAVLVSAAGDVRATGATADSLLRRAPA